MKETAYERQLRRNRECYQRKRATKKLDPRRISIKEAPDGERWQRVCATHGKILEIVHVVGTPTVQAVCPEGHEIKGAEDADHGGSWLCWDLQSDRLYAVVHGLDVTIMRWEQKDVDSVQERA